MPWFRSLLLLIASASIAVGESPPKESHFLLYLADSGVVVIQVQVLIDGQSPGERFEGYVDSLLKDLDRDQDGKVTTDEARGKLLTSQELPLFQVGVNERPAANTTALLKTSAGGLNRSDLLAYFKQIGLLPFSVQLQGRLTTTASEVPLFAQLDTNGNRLLSIDELSSALDVLRKLDRDDDETISVAELQPLAASPQPAAPVGMSPSTPPPVPFLSLATGESIPRLVRRIVEKYDREGPSGAGGAVRKNQKLSSQELGMTEAGLQSYDIDGDGELDSAELRQLISSPVPKFELLFNLTAGTVRSVGKEAPEIRDVGDGTVNLNFGDTQINIVATPSDRTFDPEAMSKPVFLRSDVDANGYLDGDEIQNNPLLTLAAADLDADNNGKIFLDEFVAYMKPRLNAVHTRCELLVVEQGRTLFDILDFDRDGRLSHREVRDVGGKLVHWDSNGDGQLALTEIPQQFRIVTSQGSLMRLGASRSTPQGPAVPMAGPAWFQKMDRNRDGEVSRREFLGNLDLFEKLDANQNGAVEISETALRTSTSP